MKKLFVIALMLTCGLTVAFAQKPAEIKFDKLTHDFGTFSEKNPVVTCVFTYTNVGEEPLIINQAIASCGLENVSTTSGLMSNVEDFESFWKGAMTNPLSLPRPSNDCRRAGSPSLCPTSVTSCSYGRR